MRQQRQSVIDHAQVKNWIHPWIELDWITLEWIFRKLCG